jgi:hypothetical protein
MRAKQVSATVAAALLVHSGVATASGDPATVLVPAFHLVIALVFLVWLIRVPTWAGRLMVSAVFFGSLLATYVAVARIPYFPNQDWLVAAVVLVPVASWLACAAFLRRKSQGKVA